MRKKLRRMGSLLPLEGDVEGLHEEVQAEFLPEFVVV